MTALGDFEGCYVTPKRARVIRAGIQAERRDAVRGGELVEVNGWIPWFGIDPPELPTAAKQGEALDADGRGEPGTATPQTGRVAGEQGPPPLRAASGPARPCGICGARPARLYVPGWRCPSCAPPVAPTPDPARTAAALREARERYLPALRRRR